MARDGAKGILDDEEKRGNSPDGGSKGTKRGSAVTIRSRDVHTRSRATIYTSSQFHHADNATQSSPMGTEEEETHDVARSMVSTRDPRVTESILIAPIQHRGASSTAMNCPEWSATRYVPRPGLPFLSNPFSVASML